MPNVAIQKVVGNPNAGGSNEVGIGWDTATGQLKINDAGTVHNVGNGYRPVESLTAAKTLVAADSGKTFFLNLVGGFAVTLPAVAAGLNFEFVVGIAPTTAYTIVTPGAPAQILAGQAYSSTGGDADSETDVTATTITLVANVALIGDKVWITSDGTSWFARGFSDADAGITFTG